MLEDAVAVLRWQEESQFPSALRARFLNVVFERLIGLVKTANPPITELSSERWRILARAPEVAARLLYGRESTKTFINGFLRQVATAENLRSGGFIEGTAWSANADAFFGCDGASISTRMLAPRLSCGIVVDAFMPYRHDNSCAIDVAEARQLLCLARLVAQKSEIALAAIAACAPQARMLVVDVIEIIELLIERENEATFGSSSWPPYPGKMALVNGHNPRFGPEEVANGLIHEAIHSLLYMVEYFEPFYRDFSKIREARLRSSWSGRDLYLTSWMHACFVWFGLAHFWRIALEESVFDETRALALKNYCEAGFSRVSCTETLGPYRPLISEKLWLVVGAIEEQMQIALAK